MNLKFCLAKALVLFSALLVSGMLFAQDVGHSAFHDFRIVTVADGLVRSWSMAFLPDGDLLDVIPHPDFANNQLRYLVNLTRFHGVFAPNNHYRALVTLGGRGKGKKDPTPEQSKTPAEHRASMTWAQTLKRVFSID